MKDFLVIAFTLAIHACLLLGVVCMFMEKVYEYKRAYAMAERACLRAGYWFFWMGITLAIGWMLGVLFGPPNIAATWYVVPVAIAASFCTRGVLRYRASKYANVLSPP